MGKKDATLPETQTTQSLTALIEGLLVDEHILPAQRGLARNVGDLSDFFNRLKKPLPTSGKEHLYMSDPDLRAAYLAYFFPVNCVKTFLLLRRIASEGFLPPMSPTTPKTSTPPTTTATPWRILDFGCGPGSAALGTAFYLESHLNPHSAVAELYLVDQSATVLETAVRLLERSDLPLQIHAASRIPQEMDFDLILAFNVLNENTVEESQRIFTLLKNRLSPTGRLLVAEPALRETARRLIELRDQLLTDPDVALLWPCCHCANCQGILAENDWCHGTEVWERPDWIAQIDREIGSKKERLNYAALLYATKDSAGTASASGTNITSDTTWRVVSDPIIERGKRLLYLCGGPTGERIRATALERHLSEKNRDFFAARRYDLLRIEGTLEKKGDGFRLSPETTATLRRS
ncbi:MAG TPA: hypothetical protein DER41_03720 [Firmicutes bacterium]|nr:hypothetical protein [Bacillota bacterium]HCF89045.1 hypothetical protein [Bacillota bacterium]